MCEIGLSAIVTSGLPTDRQTLRDFGRSRLRAPPTRARAGFARARPGVRGMSVLGGTFAAHVRVARFFADISLRNNERKDRCFILRPFLNCVSRLSHAAKRY